MDNENEKLVNCVLYKKIKRVEIAEISISKTMINRLNRIMTVIDYQIK